MSSKSRSKSKPRLSMAMDLDPTAAEAYRPPEPAEAEPAADPPSATAETQIDRGPSGRPPAAGRRASRAARRRPPTTSQAQAPSEDMPTALADDPAVHVINGRVYVQVGEDLMPEGARVQMTIALTAMERHRWLRYAEENGLTLIEVLRRAMDALLD